MTTPEQARIAELEAEVERLKLQVMRREAVLMAFGATARHFVDLDGTLIDEHTRKE